MRPLSPSYCRARGWPLAPAVLFLGCTSPLPHPPYVQQPTPSALAVVPFPPPPARPEVVPNEPAKAAVWIDGEWVWRGRRWGWTAGRWVIPPAGASFSPWTTVRDEAGNLYFAQGAWRDPRGEVVPEPPPLALGTNGAAATPDPAPASAPAPSPAPAPAPSPAPSTEPAP